MNQAFQHSFGDYVKHTQVLAPVAGTGAAQTSAYVVRTGCLSAVLLVPYAITGTPTGGTITVQPRHADDSAGTNVANYGSATVVNLPTTANPSGLVRVPLDLGAADLYLGLTVDIAPTGAGVTSIVGAIIELGGADRVPVA